MQLSGIDPVVNPVLIIINYGHYIGETSVFFRKQTAFKLLMNFVKMYLLFPIHSFDNQVYICKIFLAMQKKAMLSVALYIIITSLKVISEILNTTLVTENLDLNKVQKQII